VFQSESEAGQGLAPGLAGGVLPDLTEDLFYTGLQWTHAGDTCSTHTH
jgi:hypothetical protein